MNEIQFNWTDFSVKVNNRSVISVLIQHLEQQQKPKYF